MRCEDALLLISGHLDNENTIEEETALQTHLNGCEDCCRLLQIFKETDLELSSLREPAPQELCKDVMTQIKKETAKKKHRPWYGLAIAAALILVIGFGTALGSYDEAVEPQTVSVADTQVMSRGLPAVDPNALAKQLAQERNAPVALVHELYYEMEMHPCETLEEGYLLYLLPEHDAAMLLGDDYGCVIYEPDDGANSTVSYALLVP